MAKLAQEAEAGVRELQLPEHLPLVPLQDTVMFPFMRLQLTVEREASVAAVQHALRHERMIFLAAQREATTADPSLSALYDIGTVAVILQWMPQESGVMVVVQGIVRARLRSVLPEAAFRNVSVERLDDLPSESPIRETALRRNVLDAFSVIAMSKELPSELVYFLQTVSDPTTIAYAVAGNLRLEVIESQALLEETDPLQRLERLYHILVRESEVISLQNRIRSATDDEVKKRQKEYYLREQMRAIQNELGGSGGQGDIDLLREKLAVRGLPEVAEKEVVRQLARLERMPQEGPEAESVRNYLEWLAELPWNVMSEDAIDIAEARRILDEDHAFLEKIKERILEFLAVHRLKKAATGSIICFVGPPGTGKTSLGKSIARAMGRTFIRISLGGIHDEAEIRGHRRTYIGAMPGRIIYALKQAGTRNPVFMLDEIDKIGQDFRGGDPYSALLEVLDPQQNNSFTDHYLNLPFDLSNVVFITTANSLEHIPGPLLDRMETIHLAGYTEEEKQEIARRYLIARQIEENGLAGVQVSFPAEAVREIIAGYTREAGLRNLERAIGRICRKLARRVAEGEEGPFEVAPAEVAGLMGIPPFIFDTELEQDEVGTVTGLAWTPAGGEIIFVEASSMLGEPTLHLTGSLGEVMKESADAALTYIRANAERYAIPHQAFRETSLHIHVPAGALPKDGPSAGVTMATAILSTLTRSAVRREVAMTGEITLRGKVLPIGGLKEKILGAVRAGITTIVIPEGNVRDLDDIPQHILEKVRIVPARSVDEVFSEALVKG